MNDDFWKILSESDDGDESGIDILLKSKSFKGSSEPNAKDVQEKASEAAFTGRTRGSNDEEQLPQASAGSSERWSTLTVNNTTIFNEEADIFTSVSNNSKPEASTDPLGGKEGDFFANKMGRSSVVGDGIGEEASSIGASSSHVSNAEESCSAQSGAKISVDEMDFLWDDDEDEQFIVEKISRMSVSKDKDASDADRIKEEGAEEMHKEPHFEEDSTLTVLASLMPLSLILDSLSL